MIDRFRRLTTALVMLGATAACDVPSPLAPGAQQPFRDPVTDEVPPAVTIPRVSFAITKSIDVTNLGTLGNGALHVAQSINNRGHVVGTSTDNAGNAHAFFWSPETNMIDLGTTGGAQSYGQDINDQDMVVGRSLDASGVAEAFVWTPGGTLQGLTQFGGFESRAFGVNDKGEVVGRYTDMNGAHGFRWNGSLTTLPTLGSPNFGFATSINDVGEVVGMSTATADPADPIVSYKWSETAGIRSIGSLGASFSEHDVFNINRMGQVAGGAYDESTGLWVPFVWSETNGFTPLTQFGFPSTWSGMAMDVNILGHVAVLILRPDGTRTPAVWVKNTGVVTMPIMDGGTGNGEIWAINDMGVIVGWSDNGAGQMRPAKWRVEFSADDRIGDVIDLLDGLIDTIGDKKIVKELDKAVDHAQKALQALAKPDVDKAVNELKHVVKELIDAVDVGLDPGIGTDVLEILTETARDLAVDAIDDALDRAGDPKDIAKAQQHLANGDASRATADYEDAVKAYRDAVKDAEKA